MKNLPNYQRIPHLLLAIENCTVGVSEGWREKHEESLTAIMATAPSGSGLDSGTTLDRVKTNGQRLAFETSFHHMNQNGFYDGWTDHNIIVTADLTFDFGIRITGRNRNEIKEYLNDVFDQWLREEST